MAHLNIDNKKFLKAEINLKLSLQYKIKLARKLARKYAASYLMSVVNISYIMTKDTEQKGLIQILTDSMEICKKVIEDEIQNAYPNALKVLTSYNNLKKILQNRNIYKNLNK